MGKIRIAIVDDKLLLRTTLQEQLSYYDELEVAFIAEDGRDFLRKMENLQANELPHLVLMDIEMPNMDGIEAVAFSRELYPSTLCLMLTVFDDDEKLFEAIKMGACGYLLKDEEIGTIEKAIKECVYDGGVPMSPKIAQRALQLLRNAESPEPKQKINKLDIGLTVREIEILQCIIAGLDYQEIGNKLFISKNTVRTHTANIYIKLQVTNKASAIKLANDNRWFN